MEEALTPDVSVDRVTPSRSRRIWLSVGLGLAIAGVVCAVVWFVLPHPEATLGLTDERPDDQIFTEFFLGDRLIGGSTLQGYESYRGVEPWTGVDSYGNACLMLFDGSANTVLDEACTPAEADLMVDLEAWPVLDLDFAEGLPDGSVVRFHHRGGSIDVFVYRPPIVDPGAGG